jgi:hypothetical protein
VKPVYAGYPAPDPSPPDAARLRADALRQTREVQKRRLRRRVISAAVALFAAVWLMIAITLVTGHDPALAAKTAVTATAGTTSGTTTATTATSGASNTTSSASANSSSTGLTSVTTRQS